MRPLILGSSSPRRSQLLTEAGYAFEVVPSAAEESDSMSAGLSALVEENALKKAQWVAEQRPDAVVIGADTLVSIDGEALGKPADLAVAMQMLLRLSGRKHQVCTGVALCCAGVGESLVFHVVTEVTFRELGEEQIGAYFDKVNPLDKAGAYGAQEHGDDIIDHMTGSWSNVVGLPLEPLETHLESFRNRLEVAR